MTDILGNLERLQNLRETGVLTEEEFQSQKSEILARSLIRDTEPTDQHETSIGYQNHFPNLYTNKNISILGCLIVSIGVFLPAISVPILGNINFIQNGDGIGILLLAVSLLTAILSLKNSVEMTIYTGAFSLSTIISTYFTFRKNLSDMQGAIDSKMSDNPFADMAGSAVDLIQLEWGWAVILLGSFLIVYAGWSERRLVSEPNGDQSGYVGYDENHYTNASLVIGMIGMIALGILTSFYAESSALSGFSQSEVNGSSSSKVSQNAEDNHSTGAGDIKLANGSCELTVEGKNYIDGQCLVDRDDDGSFYIFQNSDRTGYFAVVQIDGNSAEGYWNGEPESTHAQNPLGTLKSVGNCWVNTASSTRVCASSEAGARVSNANVEQTEWDCSSVYGEKILVTIAADEYRFYPRNPDGGALSGKLVKSAKEENAYTGGYDTYLNLIDSGTAPKSWSIYVGDKGPALFHYSELSGDGSECTLPGEEPRYSSN